MRTQTQTRFPCVPLLSHPSVRTVPKEIASNAVLSSYLTPSEQLDFVALMLEVNVKRGDVVIRQGEKGNNFFLVAQGQCIVSKDGNPIRMLTAGANCGELGLLVSAALLLCALLLPWRVCTARPVRHTYVSTFRSMQRPQENAERTVSVIVRYVAARSQPAAPEFPAHPPYVLPR